MSDSIFGVDAPTWQAVEAIATAAGAGIALLGIAGLGLAVYQLREQTKVRHLQGLISALEQFTAVASPELRLWLEAKELTSMTRLSDEDEVRALSLVYAFNRVGFFVQNGYIPKEAVFALFAEVAVDYWERLKPFIRRRREIFPRTAIDFERLKDDASEWMQSRQFTRDVQQAMKIFSERDASEPGDAGPDGARHQDRAP